MHRAPLAALTVLLILSLITSSRAQQVEEIRLQVGETRMIEGQLRGPENSGETHLYKVRIEPGVRIIAEITMIHAEFVGSRISTALLSPSGGKYLGEDTTLPQGGLKRFLYSWLPSSISKDYGYVLIAVGSVANRYAPSVVNYTIKVSLTSQRDGEGFGLGIGDAPSRLEDATPMADKLVLKPGVRVALKGFLSPEKQVRDPGDVKLYGGDDLEDYYALSIAPEVGSSLIARVVPKDPVALALAIQMEDGFTLKAATSKRLGEAVEARLNFTEQDYGIIYVKVSLLRGDAEKAEYDLELLLTEPPEIPKIPAEPVVSDTQAWAIVVSSASLILAATLVSVIIGRRRRGYEERWARYP